MNKMTLENVQETLLLPLWGRAVETQKQKPLLVDTLAVSIVKDLAYDFKKIEKNMSPITCAAWIARSIYFDEKIKTFLSKYPEASVINIGCGLDTTFDRVFNGKSTWYELDLPDVIELRRKYIKESDKRIYIATSVFDESWYTKIGNKDHVFLLMAGVIYYFDEKNLKKLFKKFCKQFKHSTAVFDYSSKKGMEIANKKVIENGGMSSNARLVWWTDNIEELEQWNEKIKIFEHMPIFTKHKKNYPFYKRLGMNISDTLKIMSLAHLEISGV
ncbi:class I SAM-dependent methyltransferase [candidate division KSB1 bacterium]|nr:class I SAM-dependent methyltransferase [candidate division KSB1 bacterium]